MNESVYRSPKWLQNFLDFEFRTGEDIKGEPSEKQKRKIILDKWDERWKSVGDDEFLKFFKDTYSKYITNNHHGYVTYSDLPSMEIWDKFDMWIKKKKEEELEEIRKKKEQESIKRELDNIADSINMDFKSYPFDDKFSTPTKNGKTSFIYRFEDGRIFSLWENELSFGGFTYRLGIFERNRFVGIANEIIRLSRRRPTSSNSNKSDTKKSGNPQRDRYDLLNSKIKIRKEQLDKMGKNDPDRNALQNELDAYIRIRDKIKKEHKFEKLITFINFNHQMTAQMTS